MDIPDLCCLLKTVNKRIPFFIAGFFNDDRHPLLWLFIRENPMHAQQQHYKEENFRQQKRHFGSFHASPSFLDGFPGVSSSSQFSLVYGMAGR